MVSLEHIINAAMRSDTVVARAFRKALGLPIPVAMPRRTHPQPLRHTEPTRQEILDCFANDESILDRRSYV